MKKTGSKRRVAEFVLYLIGVIYAVPILILCIIRGAGAYGAAGVLTGLGFSLILFASFLFLLLFRSLCKDEYKVRSVAYAAVFLLFAATYTPVSLISLMKVDIATAWVLFSVVWATALVGMILSIVNLRKFANITLACYLGLSWCIILCLPNLIRVMPWIGVVMLFIGAVAFAIAAMIANPVLEEKKHGMLFHCLVLAGSMFNGLMVLLCVL